MKMKYYVMSLMLLYLSTSINFAKAQNELPILPRLFHPDHYCSSHPNDPVTTIWTDVKSPDLNANCDLIYAAHRGYWGTNLGAGPSENTPPAIAAAIPFTKVIESDVMKTSDDEIVVSHDYNLARLTDFDGTDYVYNKTLNELKQLKLRKRDGSVDENHHFMSFSDLLDAINTNNAVLTVDIKAARPYIDFYTKNCVERCEFDIKISSNAVTLWKDDFMLILEKCILKANEKNLLHLVAFKTTYTYNEIVAGMSEGFDMTLLNKVMFFPVIQPGKAITASTDFVDNWVSQATLQKIIGFETNFKKDDEACVTPFTKNGTSYQNLFHYVYQTTGLRPGIYPEEAMGPKGIVDRWAQWIIKDVRSDVRGDHFHLIDIPYYKISILTTDRPDVWNQIQNSLNGS